MATYDYEDGYKRVQDILDNKLKVVEDNIPNETGFTFDNAYYGFVTSIFIDIRDSSTIFEKYKKEKTSKIIRSFTSEIIEILRDDDNLREIGIRGDCVYAIYFTPKQRDVYEILDKSFYVNTCMNMLNKVFTKKGYIELDYGIGVATNQELVVKAGRKDTGINNLVWIGNATSLASHLSSYGSSIKNKSIYISDVCYDNILLSFKDKNGEESLGWFNDETIEGHRVHSCDIIKKEFNNWVKEL